jgi:exopolysaccharide production protein ExoQ
MKPVGEIGRLNGAPTLRIGRFPWAIFLFLATIFFLSQHHLNYSKQATETFIPPASELAAGVAERSWIHEVIVVSLGIFAVGSFICYRRTMLRINGSLGWLLLFFAGWAAISLTWADDPAQVLRRLVAFGAMCLAATATVRRLAMREILLLTFFCSILFLLIGASAELILGTFHPFTPGYRFAGTQHPNQEAINCALLLLSGVAAGDTEKRGRVFFRVCALLGLLFLILTASRTAFAAALLALAIYEAAVWSKRKKLLVVLFLGAACCVLTLAISDIWGTNFKTVANLGRNDPSDDSFNGRTGVWDQCLYYVGRRPLLGYGYDGFWTQAHITEISDAEGWGVAEAHSSYIECLLSLGLVGLAAYIFALIVGIKRSFTYLRTSHNAAFAFSGAFLIFCATHGLLESAVQVSPTLSFLTMAVLLELGFRREDLLSGGS